MPRIAVDNVEPDIKPIEVKSEVKPDVVPEPVIEKGSVAETDRILKSKSGSAIFSAFSAFPEAVRFAGEDADEEIILLMRAHLVTNVKWILATLGLLILPLIIFPLLGSVNLFPSIGAGTGLVFTLLWFAGTFTYAFVNFLYWYFNVYIVTNERVVDVDWYSILYHKTSSTRISKIQDVSVTRSGVFASAFDYGDIHIQTAANESNFEFTAVPHPELVKDKIEELMEEEEKEWEVNPDR